MSTPDARVALEAAQQAGAEAAAYRPDPAEVGMTHETEILASHPGSPTPAEAVGRGVTPASGG